MTKTRSTSSRPLSPESLSHRIRHVRRLAGLTQAQLARQIGVGPSAVAQWELPNGTSPTAEHLIQIATSCSITFEWLATGRGVRSLGASETPAIERTTFAADEFEERLLIVARRLTARKREPFIRWLEALF